MLCWICAEVDIPEIIIDQRDGKIRHCHVCEAVIQENLQMISGERQDDGELETLLTDFDEEPDELDDVVDTSFQQGYHSPTE